MNKDQSRSVGLWKWGYSHAWGWDWRLERECRSDEAVHWRGQFEKDEPNAVFTLNVGRLSWTPKE